MLGPQSRDAGYRAWMLIVAGALLLVADGQAAAQTDQPPRSVSFAYRDIAGIGREAGTCRRDPSDVIRVDDTWYVWYTKVVRAELSAPARRLYPSGYPGTIWYATSTDEGQRWEEQGPALGLGPAGSFDSFGVFTPNILFYMGKYYLFYTAVQPTPGRADGQFENNSENDTTAIGVAVASRPAGPFARITDNPILRPAAAAERFDSYRVDDSALLVRDGKIWLYYKGRSRVHGKRGPGLTQMGAAVADRPTGPFARVGQGEPLLDRSHEVLIWKQADGVAALASISRTIQWSDDGLHFRKTADVAERPSAPGLYRPELTDAGYVTTGISWGISMRHGRDPYLVRFAVVE